MSLVGVPQLIMAVSEAQCTSRWGCSWWEVILSIIIYALATSRSKSVTKENSKEQDDQK